MSDMLKTSWDDDPLMYPAFIGYLRFVLSTPEMMERYRAETGDDWQMGRTPFEQQIDRAVGAELAFFQRISDWCEQNDFGTPDDLGAA